MATVAASSPLLAFQLPLMPSPRRPSTSSLSPHHATTPMGMGGGGSALDDEDLLSLGSFKLETARDQELLCLHSFLKGVLPSGAAGNSTAHHPPALNAGLTLANVASGSGNAWANGWKPEGGAGSAAPWGSPMSFASSTASVPLGSSALSQSSFPHHHYGATPPTTQPHQQQQFAYPSPQSFAAPTGAAGGPSARGTWAAVSPPGYRAPACSRERVPTLSGFAAQQPGGAAAGSGAGGLADDGGWKSRLRPRRAAQDHQQQQGRPAYAERDEEEEDDDDAMME